jgi:hypothetical protein
MILKIRLTKIFIAKRDCILLISSLIEAEVNLFYEDNSGPFNLELIS